MSKRLVEDHPKVRGEGLQVRPISSLCYAFGAALLCREWCVSSGEHTHKAVQVHGVSFSEGFMAPIIVAFVFLQIPWTFSGQVLYTQSKLNDNNLLTCPKQPEFANPAVAI